VYKRQLKGCFWYYFDLMVKKGWALATHCIRSNVLVCKNYRNVQID
jgi:hypothetical protein